MGSHQPLYLRFLCSMLLTTPVISVPLSTRRSTGDVTWGKCSPTVSLSSWTQCANLSVPINWDEPGGEKLNLGMIRVLRQSTNLTAERLGYLFVNPGGPGYTTSSFINEIAGLPPLSPEMLESFDFIGVDPRGVGMSNSIRCNASIYNERASLFPRTQEEYEHMVYKYKRLGESCLEQTGPLVNYMDTISAAKDMEAVRLALGGEKMNFLGLSYGTQLGAQYAQLFPENIRSMVLDSMVQHSQSAASNVLIETTAYANALEEFFEWANTDERSVLKGKDVKQLWLDFMKNATKQALPILDCTNCHKDVTADEIRLKAQSFLKSSSWQARTDFATTLKAAFEGSPRGFSTRLLSLNQDDKTIFAQSNSYANLAVGCQDWSTSTSFEELQALMRMAEVRAPLTKGASLSWTMQAACIGWPTPLNNPPAKLNVKTKDPIMMVAATRDPSTSYDWAVGMTKEIENHFLLTRDGGGHTNWGSGGDTMTAMERFFLTKQLPPVGTVYNS
jgi:pimeloyl-ACP methyl ester carboxylesterase